MLKLSGGASVTAEEPHGHLWPDYAALYSPQSNGGARSNLSSLCKQYLNAQHSNKDENVVALTLGAAAACT